MSNILVLKSSILGKNSQSGKLADYAIEKLKGNNIIIRDLAVNPLPYFDSTAAIGVRGEPKTEAEKALLDLSNELVTELKNADTVIITAPMYNLSIPAQLKSYFDFITRPRVTFQYGANGAEGLVKNTKAIVISTSGGLHGEDNLVNQYVTTILKFIGIQDIKIIYAEALGLGSEAVEKSQAQAQAKIDQLFA